MNNRLIPEKELEKIVEIKVKKILADLLGVGSRSTDKCLPTSKAWIELNYRNQDQLYSAINSGLFRLGKEYEDRRLPQHKKAKYYFYIDACLQRLKESPDKRSK